MKKYFLFLLIIFLISFAPQIQALGTSDVSGFTPGQIWYSKEPLVEGETVNIHTSLWNGESNSLSVKVEFYDKNVIFGSRDVVVKASELKDVFVPWKITAGDHTISAKIISSLEVVSSDKKEEINLTRSTTSNYKQSVAATVKNSQGETVSALDTIKTELNKVGDGINDVIPTTVSSSVSSNLSSVEKLRNNTSVKIDDAKQIAKKELDIIDKVETKIGNKDVKSSTDDIVKKPLVYIKLFLLLILSFIFNNKIVFYGVSVFIIFSLVRFIYRKIRNR